MVKEKRPVVEASADEFRLVPPMVDSMSGCRESSMN
jgi:hypothetical protein